MERNTPGMNILLFSRAICNSHFTIITGDIYLKYMYSVFRLIQKIDPDLYGN